VNKKLQLIEPKTNKSCRVIKLPQVAVTALCAHKERQEQERLLAGNRWQETGLVFTTRVGTPIDARRLLIKFKIILTKAELPDIRFHDLRHSCATLLLAQGVHPRIVMDLLGHSQIGLTMNTYSHVIPAMQNEVANRMDEILTPVAVNVAVTEEKQRVN
jgi:integrase